MEVAAASIEEYLTLKLKPSSQLNLTKMTASVVVEEEEVLMKSLLAILNLRLASAEELVCFEHFDSCLELNSFQKMIPLHSLCYLFQPSFRLH